MRVDQMLTSHRATRQKMMVWLPYWMTRSSQCHSTARERSGAFDVGAQSGQVADGVAVIHPDDVLLDDRAVVELFGHVVSGRADELDAALLGPPIGRGADERRQEGVVDVDHRATDLVEELRLRICM